MADGPDLPTADLPSEDRNPPPRRRRIRLGWMVGLVLLVALIAAGAAFVLGRSGDELDPDVPFDAAAEPTSTATPRPTRRHAGREPAFSWAHYGFSKDRRRYLPADASLRPPFRRVWSLTGSILLEFSPVMEGRSLYLLKNNGAVYAVAKRTGEVRWKRKVGYLAASAPAVGGGRVFVTLLARRKGENGRVLALRASDGKILWSRDLPSRSESSPLLDSGRVYFGTEDGTVLALRASDGAERWRFRAAGAVKAALSLADGKLYFGDYSGRMYALRRTDGSVAWSVGTSGARLGLSSGRFYATAAVAYGRVYIGNTDGSIYSFSTDNGRLAWRHSTGAFVYAAPAVANVPGGGPTVYAGSYNGRFYALDARTGAERWTYDTGGKISGAATVIGDIVYFSDLGGKRTFGLGARTGRKVLQFGRGSFNPVISDGQRIYLTGYSSLYAMVPRRR